MIGLDECYNLGALPSLHWCPSSMVRPMWRGSILCEGSSRVRSLESCVIRSYYRLCCLSRSTDVWLSDELGSMFHAACVQDMLTIIHDPPQALRGEYLATTCILRSYEILTSTQTLFLDWCSGWDQYRRSKGPETSPWCLFVPNIGELEYGNAGSLTGGCLELPSRGNNCCPGISEVHTAQCTIWVRFNSWLNRQHACRHH